MVTKAKIKLSQGKFALVDSTDFDWLNQFKWYAHRDYRAKVAKFYACRGVKLSNGKRGMQSMHRFILDISKGLQCDHINQNGLDNRRENLRICSCSQNQSNRLSHVGASRYKGVSRRPVGWKARIGVNRESIYLGDYKIEEDAARAYDTAALKYFGEFALTNKMAGLLQ